MSTCLQANCSVHVSSTCQYGDVDFLILECELLQNMQLQAKQLLLTEVSDTLKWLGTVKYHKGKIHLDRSKKNNEKKLLSGQQTNNFKPWQTFYRPVASFLTNPSRITPFREVSVLEFYLFLGGKETKKKSVFSVLFPLALPARRRRGVLLSFHMK